MNLLIALSTMLLGIVVLQVLTIIKLTKKSKETIQKLQVENELLKETLKIEKKFHKDSTKNKK